MSRWIRWYEGATEDGKFRAVARASGVTVRDVIALWASMLEDAGHLDHRGVCQRTPVFMASVLDFDDDVVPRVLGAMQDIGIISIDLDGITIRNWGKRQFESDADRTALRRQREKRQRDGIGYTPVTRDTGGSDTETETDTDTEAKRKKKSKSRAVADATFDEFFKSFPKRKGGNPRTPAIISFNKAVETGADPQSIIAGAKGFADECHADQKLDARMIPMAVTWLNQLRWQDYDLPGFTGPKTIFVNDDSPGGIAWTAYERATTGRLGPRSNGGWHRETEYPPLEATSSKNGER